MAHIPFPNLGREAMATIEWTCDIVPAAGLDLQVMRSGEGPSVVVLHRGFGALDRLPFYDALAENHAVLIPHHPGFGVSPRPDWVGNVRDIAVIYRALLG